MARRTIDSGIWDEDWFIDLSGKEQLFWMYLCTRCDHGGIWRPNRRLFETTTKFRIDWPEFLKKVNSGLGSDGKPRERIRVLPNGRWLLLGFIRSQYYTGKLCTRNAAHRGAIACLAANEVSLESMGYEVDPAKGQASPYLDPTKGLHKHQQLLDLKDLGEREGCGQLVDNLLTTFLECHPKVGDRAAVEKAWATIPGELRQVAVDAAVAYAAQVRTGDLDSRYVMEAARWIESGGWKSATMLKKAAPRAYRALRVHTMQEKVRGTLDAHKGLGLTLDEVLARYNAECRTAYTWFQIATDADKHFLGWLETFIAEEVDGRHGDQLSAAL